EKTQAINSQTTLQLEMTLQKASQQRAFPARRACPSDGPPCSGPDDQGSRFLFPDLADDGRCRSAAISRRVHEFIRGLGRNADQESARSLGIVKELQQHRIRLSLDTETGCHI